ncbi:hypothetical protein FFWV33_12165 [Flavobacterium faecale]|uniref:Uncharacterized protein n=1 Tax=Flavobacterium faecale TaxID=1355330 RepID=A0A2S1LF95_9FLAO|nr:VanZ family protein [Flavobacterium faecale]AWG22216.1 hypothetical protein FFWV33_12165 [Flavobacterium faecale]
MLKRIVQVLLVFVVAAVFYYSWLPDPNMRSESYLPGWLSRWSNRNYNFRTAVPFIALGFLLEFYSYKNLIRENKQQRRIGLLKNMIVAALVVLVAEGGQFLLKSRSPDLMDVYYGILGSIVGAIGFQIFKILKTKVRNA